MPDAASSSRNTSILSSSHVRLGTWQVFHPPATEPGYIRTAGGGNPAVLSPLSPLAVPLLLKPLVGRMEESFRRRLEVLPAATRRLMLVAAAEPAGDPAPVWRAAERLGVGAGAGVPAAGGGVPASGGGGEVRRPPGGAAGCRGAVAA